MKAILERDGCIGCGLCAEICPAVFRLAEDNLAEVYGPVALGDLDAAHEAEHSCPVAVIQVTE